MNNQEQFLDSLDKEQIPILCFGIVNPFGPTLMGLTILKKDLNSSELIWFAANPFSQKSEKINTYDFSIDSINNLALFPSPKIEADISLFLKLENYGTPTFLISEFFEGRAGLGSEGIFKDLIKMSENPNKTLTLIRDFPLNVMERVIKEQELTRNKPSTNVSSFQFELNKQEISDPKLEELLLIITDYDHVNQEMIGFNTAWQGSIKFQQDSGNVDIAENAMPLDSILDLIAYLFPNQIESILGSGLLGRTIGEDVE